jgi:hypothetical protein
MLNAHLIACSLAFFPPTQPLSDIRTVIGVLGFLLFFAGNGMSVLQLDNAMHLPDELM